MRQPVINGSSTLRRSVLFLVRNATHSKPFANKVINIVRQEFRMMELKDLHDATAFILKNKPSIFWYKIANRIFNGALMEKISLSLFAGLCKKIYTENNDSTVVITLKKQKHIISQKEFILLYLSSYQELCTNQISIILKQEVSDIETTLARTKSKLTNQ